MAIYGYIALYFLVPIVSIWISGRLITWQGWIVVVLFWPVAWLFQGPEELP